jgi:DNA-binding transcriptional LysR family regulator
VLGAPLFDRSPQGVEPTPYGRALLKRSIAIFDDLRTSVEEIKFLADPTSGELRIGSTEPLLAGLGAAVMERLWRQHPRINFQVVDANSATLLARELPDRRVELAIVPLVGTFVSEELEATILFRDHLRLVVGTKSRWASRRRVTLADLTDEPWCVASSAIGSLIAEAFHTSGLPMPRIAMTTTTAHLLFRMLESGRFVGHFGDRLLQFYTDRFALKTLPIEPAHRFRRGPRSRFAATAQPAEDGATVFAHACQLGAEGILSKRVDGTYRSGPSRAWIKVRSPASIAVQRGRSEIGNRRASGSARRR